MRRSMLLIFLPFVISLAAGQDRLQTMPRYDRYEKLRREIAGAYKSGEVTPTWAADGSALGFTKDGKQMKVDLKTFKISEGEVSAAAANPGGRPPGQRGNPARGRQFDKVYTEDGKMMAITRDRNVYIANADGTNEKTVTTEGSVAARTKYGVASWVYGEELNVREAMWFSPDGKKLAYYRFDESKVPDYFIAYEQTKIQDTLDTEAYPKAGAPNPEVELWVYDIASASKTKIDTMFGDAEIGHYVYDVAWSRGGDELLYKRTNRKQNDLQFCAADPATGKSRIIVEERQRSGWVENHPTTMWLGDGKGFLWVSDRSGFNNIYLGNIDGRPLKVVTAHPYEVDSIVKVDEDAKEVWYMARSAANPYFHQLHRIGMDGQKAIRLTDLSLSHTVRISPDGKFFVDIAESYEDPATSTLRDRAGKEKLKLAESDLSKFNELHLQKTERIVCKAADGVTDMYGYLQKPSDFDPTKKYPLLVSMYAGPDSGTDRERFLGASPTTELGFLVAWFDGRGTRGRGREFKTAVYKRLGIVEIDDQAAGAAFLAKRPYVDANAIGAFGTSYGGYSSCMCLLRHPEVFAAACSSSPVTHWGNYDSIYTERYMSLPTDDDNKAGYENGSAMKYAKDLKGRLMLFYGSADNNVHPSNTMQLVQALQRAGKSFDLMVGPDMGHSGINQTRMWEFFVDNLILNVSHKGLEQQYKAYRARRK
jgi:dipeptidyl-peptidase-4